MRDCCCVLSAQQDLGSTAYAGAPTLQSGSITAPLAGYGVGLPLSRLYARYFGGDLQLLSMEGFGTDVFLHLNRLGAPPSLPRCAATLPSSSPRAIWIRRDQLRGIARAGAGEPGRARLESRLASSG